MRASWWLAMILVLGGCSCDRRPDAQTPPPNPPAQVDATPSGAEPGVPTAIPTAAASAQAANLSAPVSTVHAYLAAVAGKDWDKADAFWSGGKPPPRPDDYALRGIDDLRSMRINNASPEPLDRESPPRSVEIPVVLRVQQGTGTYEVRGWYRLRRKIGGDGWEITSAAMQPSIR